MMRMQKASKSAEQECRKRAMCRKKRASSTFLSGCGFQNLQGGSLRVELSRSPALPPHKIK